MLIYLSKENFFKKKMPNVVVYAYNLSTSEAEAGKLLSV